MANVWEASNERLIDWWIGTEGAGENAALLRERRARVQMEIN